MVQDFDSIYKKEFKKVNSYLQTLTTDRELAEELTQETFYRALLSERAGFSGRSNITTWLCAIAKNLLIDETRRRSIHTELHEDILAESDLEVQMEDSEMALFIRKKLDELQPMYRQVFVLRTFGNLSFRDIGEKMGKTEGWARVTYHRAKEMIRERLGVRIGFRKETRKTGREKGETVLDIFAEAMMMAEADDKITDETVLERIRRMCSEVKPFVEEINLHSYTAWYLEDSCIFSLDLFAHEEDLNKSTLFWKTFQSVDRIVIEDMDMGEEYDLIYSVMNDRKAPEIKIRYQLFTDRKEAGKETDDNES